MMMKTKRRREKRKRIVWEIERAYGPLVHTVSARFQLRDEDDGREAVHTVAVRLLSKGVPRVGNWRRFLSKAAVNQHKSAQQEKKTVLMSELSEDEQRRIVEEVPSHVKSPATLAAEADLQAVIQAEVAKLAPRQRAVLTLWSRDFTHKEIVATLGLENEATSRSTLRNGLAALGKRLRAIGILDCTFCSRNHSR